MKFSRHFTKPGTPIVNQIKWKTVTAEIPGTFKMESVEVPAHWSPNATNMLAQKYFRKAGVPTSAPGFITHVVKEDNIPGWLMRSTPSKEAQFGSETSAKQVFNRLAGHWTYTGWKEGYFSSEEDAKTFYHEIYYMLAMQIAAPNSPQWFNTGLWWAYGITGSDSGQWRCDPTTGEPIQLSNSYEHPQVHACFINSISDNLVEQNGIFDLLAREARIFKYGSGAGSNFSKLRGKNEPLSGGGKSSGLMSFLDIFDKAAGAIQSGGTTRRAAKMVVLDMDHPEIEDFINWKVREEAKAAAMYVGSMVINGEGYQHRDIIPPAILDRIANEGEYAEFPVFDLGWESENLRTIGGQNSNNSVRPTNSFMECLESSEAINWNLRARSDGKTVRTIDPKVLWNKLCTATWSCGDPGIQFHDNINLWNTCAADGEIVSTNPCGEYNFLDDTACNLASINLVNTLLPPLMEQGHELIWETLKHATRLWMVVLDISVSMASFPSKEIAIGSWKYRTTGLGYANLGALLMRLGLPYDSDDARNLAGSITALMHAVSYATSAELAKELGAFPRWSNNIDSMQKVIQMHAQKAFSKPDDLGWGAARVYFNQCAPTKPEYAGFRNAQTTLIAPTGTISFVMDCDTTGIEPDFALVKLKALAGGGSMSIINESVEPALRNLGYDHFTIQIIMVYLEANKTIKGCPQLIPKHQPIFDIGNDIPALGHIKMMAAVQPFLSGAISKTVALPNSATVADIDFIYRESWRLGLKCIAPYRDGSKLTQPLSDAAPKVQLKTPFRFEPVELLDLPLRGTRIPLPVKCTGYRRKFKIDGHSCFLHTGEYNNGTLGEIFLELSREGSTLRAFANSWAIAVSLGLQYGVPLEEFVEAFVHTKFEPAGVVEDHESIKLASSILNLVARELGIQYLGQYDLADIKQTQSTIAVSVETVTRIDEVREAITYKIVASGDICWQCGNATLVRTGTCVTCNYCGANSGCG